MTLYARIKEDNKKFVSALAKEHKLSESLVVDYVFECLRTTGKFSCSSIAKIFKSA